LADDPAEKAGQGAPYRSSALRLPHGFLTAAQSDVGQFDLVAPGIAPVFVKQVHSARVVEASCPFADGERPEADAIVSATPGTMLAIVTADCAPVLFADVAAGVVGAAHAGWRGAFGGVLENTVAAMEALGAARARIIAVIGPTIAQTSYEVDERFRETIVGAEAASGEFFQPGAPGHFQFDLPAYVQRRLAHSCEVGTVDDLAVDTYENGQGLYSYRRATHLGGPTGGRQFSAIVRPA